MSTIDPSGAAAPGAACANGHSMGEDSSFCESCGSPRASCTPAPAVVCANGHPMQADDSFCQSCGEPRRVDAPEAVAPPAPYQAPYQAPFQHPNAVVYGPPAGSYGAVPGYAPFPVQSQTYNGMAIASMVLGILWIYWIGSVLALIFGYVALKQIRERHEAGRGMALAGVILGWVGAAILVLVVIVGIAASSSNGFNVISGSFLR